jgi:molecular chaperone GrpE
MEFKNPFNKPDDGTDTPLDVTTGSETEESPIAALTAERDQMATEIAEMRDRLLRRTAEFDNYRKRVEREKAEFLEYASSEAVTALLPVLDDFERALKHPTADAEYARGMEMIYSRLTEALKKLGLEPVSAVGQPFDPYIHQAVDRAESAEHDEHTVLDEYQRGYNFKGRLLRPAMVKVSVRPASAEKVES